MPGHYSPSFNGGVGYYSPGYTIYRQVFEGYCEAHFTH